MKKKLYLFLAFILVLSSCQYIDKAKETILGQKEEDKADSEDKDSPEDKENSQAESPTPIESPSSGETQGSGEAQGSGETAGSAEAPKSSLENLEVLNLEEIIADIARPDKYKSYTYDFTMKTDTVPDKSTYQEPFYSEHHTKVVYDGENKSEVSVINTVDKLDGKPGQESIDLLDIYIMKNNDSYTYISGMGNNDFYGKETYQLHPEEVNMDLDFTLESQGLVYDEILSDEKVAVFTKTFKDDEIIDYYLNQNENYEFKDVKGTLLATIKIDRLSKSLIEYSTKADMESTSIPNDDYVKYMYSLTNGEMEFEKYAEEYKKVSVYKAKNNSTTVYNNFEYNLDVKVEVPKKVEEALEMNE